MIKRKKYTMTEILWDLWCCISVVGIWPRFIEPNLIWQSKLDLKTSNNALDGFKIVQFTDLHFSSEMSDGFLAKLKKNILINTPDLIVFTGDFICFSNLEDENRLKNFLNSLHAPFGCFAIFGNHDYQDFVSINSKGEYDVVKTKSSTLKRGFKRLFSRSITLKGISSNAAMNTKFHEKLGRLLKETPFQLLHNETISLDIGLNLCGLGEYSVGKCLPEQTFEKINPQFPTIVLTHNPDSVKLLKNYPADLILSGHTHGGQVNLPGFRKKFITMENSGLVRGLVFEMGKKIYVNRGIGSVMKFRWFAVPEILTVTFKRERKSDESN